MSYSAEHCRERIEHFTREFKYNQEKATKASEDLSWWQVELTRATREENERASRKQAA